MHQRDDSTASETYSRKQVGQLVTIAAAVASLGASLGVDVNCAIAMNKSEKTEAVQPTSDVRQIKLVKQFKFYNDGTAFNLKNSENMIIISGGKAMLRNKNGAQTTARNGIYELRDGSKLNIQGGKILQ